MFILRQAERFSTPETRKIEGDEVPAGERAILDAFTEAVRTREAPECNAEDNLGSLAMVFAAIQSAKEGRKVRLDELK